MKVKAKISGTRWHLFHRWEIQSDIGIRVYKRCKCGAKRISMNVEGNGVVVIDFGYLDKRLIQGAPMW